MPLPLPPQADMSGRAPLGAMASDDRRSPTIDAKLATLRDYRRARGLCFRCGDHRCPKKIQVHVLQEIWDLCHSDESEECGDSGESEDQVLAVEILADTSGSVSARAILLSGSVQGKAVSILVDSGSSCSFLSETLATQLSGASQLTNAPWVRIADRSLVPCSLGFRDLNWEVQGISFKSSFLVMPLPFYDMILGMDWLASFSPMQIDWQHKWLIIPYGDSTVRLQGQLTELPTGSVIQVSAVFSESTPQAPVEIPPVVSALLSEFQSVFDPPSGYPPPRQFDHPIPLDPGASPKQVRPYRYSPAVKDEIERQVSEMLQAGIIQPSTSPFSSAVLLVKKKDGSFRFCVDFWHLNAIKEKAKYPVPVIEELLDELTHSSWFTCLDLTAGYHQIRLQPGEEPKTAFQTHSGQYEFRVMTFGLTGAPATFSEIHEHYVGTTVEKRGSGILR